MGGTAYVLTAAVPQLAALKSIKYNGLTQHYGMNYLVVFI